MQIYTNNKAVLFRNEYLKTYKFMSADLLKLHISYLQINLNYNTLAKNNINKFYKREACQFMHYATTEIRKNVIESAVFTRLVTP